MNNTLIIQLDGVSYSTVKEAIDTHSMPFVSALVNRGWKLRETYSGLPSTTPAAQVSLFYGISVIPNFRFILKDQNLIFKPGSRPSVMTVEALIKRIQPNGLLRGGSAILTLFSGGAHKGMSLGLAKKNKILASLLIFLSNPITVLSLLLKAYILLTINRLEAKEIQRQKKSHLSNSLIFKIKRILEELFLAEFAKKTVKREIQNDTPVIYVNFSGYDEIAHQYRPKSRFVTYYLTILDLYVQNIVEFCKKKNKVYELIILSDHGQTDSIPFQEVEKMSLGQKISTYYPNNKIAEHTDVNPDKIASDIDMYLLYSGGVATIYFPKIKGQATQEVIDAKYSDFFKNVSTIDGLEVIVCKQKHAVLFYRDGVRIQEEFRFSYLSKDEHERTLNEIINIMNSPFAPDVLIFGKSLTKSSCIVFEDQYGAHGSFVRGQTQSFILSNGFNIPNNTVYHLKDLHTLLYQFIYGNTSNEQAKTKSLVNQNPIHQ